MATYAWLTQTAAIAALQGRLKNTAYWTSPELWVYLTEALRHWNGLTEQWNATINVNSNNGQWINTGTLSTSPRLRTVTDQYLYGQMCSMLLENQLSAGAWNGTNQFTLQDFQYCLQKRTQEVIQATSSNIAQLTPIQSLLGPGTRSTLLPDSVLEPRRIRFMALMAQTTGTATTGALAVTLGLPTGIQEGYLLTGPGLQTGTFVTSILGNVAQISLPTTGTLAAVQAYMPLTLTREDFLAFEAFEPEYPQEVGFPQSWDVASQPPLSFDVDIAPTTPGYFDILALNAAPTFAPPTPSLLGVPDDWSMVPMYGALADLLGMEPEASDRDRAAYCLGRYTQMLGMMKEANWLLQAYVNATALRATSLAEMDAYAPGWEESNSNLPALIQAGMDFVAPIPGASKLISLIMVGNAPLLDATNTYVQVSRDDFEAVLNYAQHLALFKQGGSAFMDTMPLLKDFYRSAVALNKRWATYGIFVEELRSQGKIQKEAQPKEKVRG